MRIGRVLVTRAQEGLNRGTGRVEQELATYDMRLGLAVVLASELSSASFITIAIGRVSQMRGDCL